MTERLETMNALFADIAALTTEVEDLALLNGALEDENKRLEGELEKERATRKALGPLIARMETAERIISLTDNWEHYQRMLPAAAEEHLARAKARAAKAAA